MLCRAVNDCLPIRRWSKRSRRSFDLESIIDLEFHPAQMADGPAKKPSAANMNAKRMIDLY